MTQDLAIQTTRLERRYGAREVVRGIDLAVPRGAVYGFLGLNGAGKSTTIRMLMGLIRRHGGEARVLGLNPAHQDVEIKRRTGYVPDSPAFYEWMKVSEMCAFAAHYRKKEWDARRAEELLGRFRVPPDTRIKHLSKGQRAKTALVLAMAFNPELLILDEPTTGLDPVARREFVEGILSEFQQEGKTIFLSSHLVNELSGLMDYVGILHEGRLIYSGPVEDFLDSVRRVRLTFENSAPRDLTCEGMLRRRVEGRDVVLSVRNGNEESIRARIAVFNPRTVQIEPLNLEDAFVECVGEAERNSA